MQLVRDGNKWYYRVTARTVRAAIDVRVRMGVPTDIKQSRMLGQVKAVGLLWEAGRLFPVPAGIKFCSVYVDMSIAGSLRVTVVMKNQVEMERQLTWAHDWTFDDTFQDIRVELQTWALTGSQIELWDVRIPQE